MTKKATLEVRLNDKKLSIDNGDNKENIRLNDSLFNAKVTNKDNTDYLELQYKPADFGVIEEDSEDIYAALKKQNLTEITVSPCPEENGISTIALYGNFNTQVYQR